MNSISLYGVLPVTLVCGRCHEAKHKKFAPGPGHCLRVSYKGSSENFNLHTSNIWIHAILKKFFYFKGTLLYFANILSFVDRAF